MRVATASSMTDHLGQQSVNGVEVPGIDAGIDTPAMNPVQGLPAVRALLAALYCELGKRDEAERLLRLDAVEGFARFPYDLFWLYGLAVYAEVCATLHQREPARELYDRLAPWHRQLPTVPQVVNGGAVALYLGMLATVLGRLDGAESHFSEAMEIHERLRAPYWIGRTHLEHARMLLARGGPGDASRAGALPDQVQATAVRYGFAALTRQASLLRG
jgi:hypothetical protein